MPFLRRFRVCRRSSSGIHRCSDGRAVTRHNTQPRIGRGWRAWWRAATRRRDWCGGRGSCFCGRKARATGKTKRTAYRWRDRYLERGVAGLERDASRPGRKPPLSAAVIGRVVDLTLRETPPARTHWITSVQRIWAAHGLKPHLAQLQALERPEVLREGAGHCRALIRPTRRWSCASMRRARPRRSTAPKCFRGNRSSAVR